MTFLTGPAAVLGEPSLKGHILAAEEINARRRHPRQAQDRDHHGGRAGRHRRQRQRASPHEALREDRHVHRRHLQRQHAGARTGGRGARPAHDLRRRLHRLPLGQGGAEPEVHVPHHQHPVGRRRHLRGGGGADLADRQEDRPHPSRLQLRPQRLRPLHDRLQEDGARRRGRSPKPGRSSAPPTSTPTSPRRCRPIPTSSCRRCGAATTWRCTSRRCASACSTMPSSPAPSPSAWRRTPSARTTPRA